MNLCIMNEKRYLVPDRYADRLREKLGAQALIRPLANLSDLREARPVNLLIDDARFTGRFRAKNLDFILAEQPFPLLCSLPDALPDHSFAGLFSDDAASYEVYNLAEGEEELMEGPAEASAGMRLVICGLGDVGGTLLTGLRLLGGDAVSEILIYDRSEAKLERWYREASQILLPDGSFMPPIRIIGREKLFTGDAFIFCVSAGVPPLGKEDGADVRMIQLEQNAAILKDYVDQAAVSGYAGHFFIVSDPVDQLCMYTFKTSKLKSRQIRGFGLGVMYARAMFHAGLADQSSSELRVFGPHGEGLAVLNSITAYDPLFSGVLTEKTRTENLAIRKTGFKPYVAPALSSGALAILACLKGEWHYSSTLLDGVWFGAKNRQAGTFTEYELLPLSTDFIEQLVRTRELLLESMSAFDVPQILRPDHLQEEAQIHAN